MIKVNFYLFLAVCESIFILIVIAVIQGIAIKKYRPYFMANTRPNQFLQKYLQRLIRQTQNFAKSFTKKANDGEATAIKARQHMTARLNWLVLERDFASTLKPDIRYWEDLNFRIKNMLSEWKEIELIKEPPEVSIVKLALQDDPEEFDYETADVEQAVKDQIDALKKRIAALSAYESMNKEMDMAYRTLENSYEELKESMNQLQLEAKEAEKLRNILKDQEEKTKSLAEKMKEIEHSKERLNQELEQLENAYVALEDESSKTSKGDTAELKENANADAKEILETLDKQEKILADLKKALRAVTMKPSQQKRVEEHTENISKTNKEINHSMQMLELERERLADEVKQLQTEAEGM